jgi:hypothetical protein
MHDIIIGALSKALLQKFPALKPFFTEAALRKLLSTSWNQVWAWAQANRKNILTAAVTFRRSAFAVITELSQDPAAVRLGVMAAGGGLQLLAKAATAKTVGEKIYGDATRRMTAAEGDER